jgi:hypothetical protein
MSIHAYINVLHDLCGHDLQLHAVTTTAILARATIVNFTYVFLRFMKSTR